LFDADEDLSNVSPVKSRCAVEESPQSIQYNSEEVRGLFSQHREEEGEDQSLPSYHHRMGHPHHSHNNKNNYQQSPPSYFHHQQQQSPSAVSPNTAASPVSAASPGSAASPVSAAQAHHHRGSPGSASEKRSLSEQLRLILSESDYFFNSETADEVAVEDHPHQAGHNNRQQQQGYLPPVMIKNKNYQQAPPPLLPPKQQQVKEVVKPPVVKWMNVSPIGWSNEQVRICHY
jgi:hypothetical protein